jgi:hypothetical protein
MKKTFLVFTAILLFLFGFFYSRVFDKKVDLNGDNLAYYALAKSVASGKGLVNFYDIEQKPANHFPPGYPYLIASLMRVGVHEVLTIKVMNGVLFGASLVVLLLLFYRLSSNLHLAFLACMAVFLNGHLIRSSFIMMSEIPFLFYSVVSVWFFIRMCEKSKDKVTWEFVGVLLFCVAAYYTRTIGIALGFGFGFALLIRKRWLQTILFGLGFVALALPWYLRSQSLGGNSYVSNLLSKNPYRPELGVMEWGDWIPRLWENLLRYISVELPNGLFTFLPEHRWVDVPWSAWITGLILLWLMITGMFSLKKHRILLASYIGATLFIVLLWPPAWYGPRFIVAILPFFIFFVFMGAYNIALKIKNRMSWKVSPHPKWVTPICAIALFLLYKPELDALQKKKDFGYPATYQQYFDLAEWAKGNVEPNSVICARKPGLFSFFYEGPAVRYIDTFDADSVIQHMKTSNVRYVVLDQLGYSSTPRYLLPAIQKKQEYFRVVAHVPNSQTYLLRFTPKDSTVQNTWKN